MNENHVNKLVPHCHVNIVYLQLSVELRNIFFSYVFFSYVFGYGCFILTWCFFMICVSFVFVFHICWVKLFGKGGSIVVTLFTTMYDNL